MKKRSLFIASAMVAALAVPLVSNGQAGPAPDATEAGEHRYDALWPDPSVGGEEKERAFIQKWQRELTSIPAASLDAQHRIDRELLDNQPRA